MHAWWAKLSCFQGVVSGLPLVSGFWFLLPSTLTLDSPSRGQVSLSLPAVFAHVGRLLAGGPSLLLRCHGVAAGAGTRASAAGWEGLLPPPPGRYGGSA